MLFSRQQEYCIAILMRRVALEDKVQSEQKRDDRVVLVLYCCLYGDTLHALNRLARNATEPLRAPDLAAPA